MKQGEKMVNGKQYIVVEPHFSQELIIFRKKKIKQQLPGYNHFKWRLIIDAWEAINISG